jgi:hypothetical protein
LCTIITKSLCLSGSYGHRNGARHRFVVSVGYKCGEGGLLHSRIKGIGKE